MARLCVVVCIFAPASALWPRHRQLQTGISTPLASPAIVRASENDWKWEKRQRNLFYVTWAALVAAACYVHVFREPEQVADEVDAPPDDRSDGATASVQPWGTGASRSVWSSAGSASALLGFEEIETLAAGATAVHATSSLLGEGGANVVYRGAFHGADVAIKSPRTAGERELRDLRREAELMAGLRHPRVAEVFGWRDGPEHPGIVLELGLGSLFDAIHDDAGRPRAAWAARDPSDVLGIARDVASAVAFLHARRVAHRDVKSDNVLLAPGGAAKLCDFGLAASFCGDKAGDRYQRPVGTLAWMAPELHGRRPPPRGGAAPPEEDPRLPPPPPGSPRSPSRMALDDWTRCDVYSFGVCLFELRTGEAPWRGLGADAIAARARAGDRPAAAVVHASPVLESACRLCLRPRADRPRAVEADLVDVLDVAPPPPAQREPGSP